MRAGSQLGVAEQGFRPESVLLNLVQDCLLIDKTFIENRCDAWPWGRNGEQGSVNSLNLKTPEDNSNKKTIILNPLMLHQRGI